MQSLELAVHGSQLLKNGVCVLQLAQGQEHGFDLVLTVDQDAAFVGAWFVAHGRECLRCAHRSQPDFQKLYRLLLFRGLFLKAWPLIVDVGAGFWLDHLGPWLTLIDHFAISIWLCLFRWFANRRRPLILKRALLCFMLVALNVASRWTLCLIKVLISCLSGSQPLVANFADLWEFIRDPKLAFCFS